MFFFAESMCGSFETGQWACGKSLQKYDIIFRTLRGYYWCCDTIHPECRGETLRRTVSWFVTNLAPALINHFCLLLILSLHVLSHVSMPVLSGWICHFLTKKTNFTQNATPPKKKHREILPTSKEKPSETSLEKPWKLPPSALARKQRYHQQLPWKKHCWVP